MSLEDKILFPWAGRSSRAGTAHPVVTFLAPATLFSVRCVEDRLKSELLVRQFLLGTRDSARERVHGPADADSDKQKKQQRPEDVLDALFGLAASQKAEGNGNHQGKEYQGLQVSEFHGDQR